MMRLRRYRVFLVLAILTIAAFYHFTNIKQWERASGMGLGSLKGLGVQDKKQPTPPSNPLAVQDVKGDGFGTSEGGSLDPIPISLPITKETPTTTADWRAFTYASETESLNTPLPLTSIKAPPGSVPLPVTSSSVLQAPEVIAEKGQGRFEPHSLGTTASQIHWTPLPEHFPVPTESIIQLPSGAPKAIPKIQHIFPEESSTAKTERRSKLLSVKEAFKHAWAGYKQFAWMQDELSPVSGNFRNPFCGWAATLVDSLDTLWIMGLEDEFEEAVAAVKNIDFTTSIRNDIPLFETTIRYLGGLLGAYDVSDAKYRILLDKAVELAEVLMGAFDTPNRMPMTFYQWKPAFASQPHRAQSRVVLAELGSLSVEFTRLAQVTKEPKYYDAVARITIALEQWQNSTQLPGMWPISVDASGCRKPERSTVDPLYQEGRKSHYTGQSPPLKYSAPGSSKGSTTGGERQTIAKSAPDQGSAPGVSSSGSSGAHSSSSRVSSDFAHDGAASKKAGHELGFSPSFDAGSSKEKRLLSDSLPSNSSHPLPETSSAKSAAIKDEVLNEADCEPQGLASPPNMDSEQFTLGGQSDSVLTLQKEYMLLGGLNEQYRIMYEQSVDVVRQHLLFRPLASDDRNMLLSGTASMAGLKGAVEFHLRPEGTHLTCFAGGMFAIGAKIFSLEADMDIAAQLTEGCVWAYESTVTGIMPEIFHAVPCKDKTHCPWNETAWWDALDPNPGFREQNPKQQVQPSPTSSKAQFLPKPLEAKVKPVLESNPLDDPLKKAKRQLGEANSSLEVASPASQDSKMAEGLPIAAQTDSVVAPIYTPPPLPSHEEFAKGRIQSERLPPGFSKIVSKKYILRPEAIESVFIMWRTTGDDHWRQKGWQMFKAIQDYTRTSIGNSAIDDVTSTMPVPLDSMESFWLAETLKYFYLLFSDPELVNLDKYILNTEAHTFKRPT
ncbi:MAG: hypothetical protein M1836_000092 [Candelina mexicana]|nr:MAG: hypothetical protein M1836_000092 [Candelina mexicana]